jgi:hypothetical protein
MASGSGRVPPQLTLAVYPASYGGIDGSRTAYGGVDGSRTAYGGIDGGRTPAWNPAGRSKSRNDIDVRRPTLTVCSSRIPWP